MKLTKSMIEAFKAIMNGKQSLREISNELNKSISRTDEIINSLEKQGFIEKIKNYSLKNSRIKLNISQTKHAQSLKQLIFQYPELKIEKIISDSKLLFLASLCEDWISLDVILDLTGISKFAIDRYRKFLKNIGLIIVNKGLYKINEKAWPLMREFLINYKNYSYTSGIVRWKYLEETLLEITRKENVPGVITGFNRYNEFGIKMNPLSTLYKIPDKKLTKEKIFVHSLFEIKDTRTLNLVLIFYLKNKLKYKKVLPLAMKYGKFTMFTNLVSLIKEKEDKAQKQQLPIFDKKDFIKKAKLYGADIK